MVEKMQNTSFGKKIREDFPVFEKDYAYLDTAASAQKPQTVIDAMSRSYAYHYANIHRGAYQLSLQSTEAYEKARETVAKFINARVSDEIVFTHGATESFNLLAHTLGETLKAGDHILLTVLEHHSNIVPWQLLAERKGINLHYVNVNDDATLNMDDFLEKLQTYKPRLVSMTHVSNAFGSVMPVEETCRLAHQAGALFIMDAAQSAAHLSIDVQKLDVDFLVFSGHKVYGPTGIGVLYGKMEHLKTLPPFFGGGDMIEQVTLLGSTYAQPPQRFEAGTPAIVEAVGLAAAIEYLQKTGIKEVTAYEDELFKQAWNMLSHEEGVILYGPAISGAKQSSIISFNLKGIHPFDFATVADDYNVQIRVGHHCAMPAMERFGISATARLSLGIYSEISDIEKLIEAMHYAKKLFT